jgi:type II secretory pathway pseudopilin PulG
MPIDFTCPHCGTSVKVADQYAGQSGPCAHCGQTITIPVVDMGAPAAAVAVVPARGSSLPIIIVVVALGLGFVLCAGMVAALLVPALSTPYDAGQQTVCANNMRNIALAMQAYASDHGTYPPAYIADEEGRPMHSWRILLLPYLEHQDLYDRYDFDEPWDGPNNSRLADQVPEVYHCPSDDLIDDFETSYVVITGSGAIFDGEKTTRPEAIADGQEQTLLLVESSFAGIHWMEPRDVELDWMSDSINGADGDGIYSLHYGGANVCFASGRATLLYEDTSPEDLRAMISIDGGEVFDLP